MSLAPARPPFAQLDPRVRLLLAGLVSIAIFFLRAWPAMAALSGFALLILLAAGQARAAVMGAVSTALLSALIWWLSRPDRAGSYYFLAFIAYFILKFLPAVAVWFAISRTGSPTEFLHALERLRLPRTLAIPLSVTMRFTPTMAFEFECIRDSMRLRGLDVGFTSFLRQPVRLTEFLVVPLLTRSLKIADELSASALTRGFESPGPRTWLRPLWFSSADWLVLFFGLLGLAGILGLDTGWQAQPR